MVVTVVVALAGWSITHWLATNRDRANKCRDIRIKYLIEAYQRLAKAACRRSAATVASELETVIADVQLFGSPTQVEMARRISIELAETKATSFDDLLNSLRNDLRSELELTAVKTPLIWLQIEPDQSPMLEKP